MQLTIKDRIVFSSFFPKNYNLVEGVLIKDILKKVDITQEEIKEIGLQPITDPITKTSQVVWDADKAKEKEIIFTEMEVNFLKDRVKELDKEKKLNNDTFELAQKINKA